MGRMKDDLLNIEMELIEELFPDKEYYELTDEEHEQLTNKAVEWWRERFADIADDYRQYMKYKGVPLEIDKSKAEESK